jgi:hypothetical protein
MYATAIGYVPSEEEHMHFSEMHLGTVPFAADGKDSLTAGAGNQGSHEKAAQLHS